MKTCCIFIDFENVQPEDLALLKGQDYRVWIFIGANQTKLTTEFVLAVQGLGSAAEYVKIAGIGRNALDFHIAYYLGSTTASGTSGKCFVISKDTGFDPLIRHLKEKGLSCRRFNSIGEIPGLRGAAAKAPTDPAQRVLENLAKRATSKPRTLETLRSSIKHLLGEEGTEEAVNHVMQELERRNEVKIDDSKVSYRSDEDLQGGAKNEAEAP